MNFLESFMDMDGGNKNSPSIGQFIKTEYLKTKFIETIKNSDKDEFLIIIQKFSDTKHKSLVEYLREVLDILGKHKLDSDAAFLKGNPNQKQNKPVRWNYEGRFFTQWINYFAKKYGWNIKEIFELNINFASYLMQEILIDEQFEKEWQYQLSEIAYPYDKGTKKSKYVPLPKPFWMSDNADAKIEKIKIPLKLLPYGVTVLSGIETPNAIEDIKE